jgi:tetratricopeptide (TPR) repeat protein
MSMLANAAFGDAPELWPLPPASTPRELWLRAVAAGGQGHYGSATADLDTLCRRQRAGPLVSLAHSTRASFLRQLGWHDRARRWDGLALLLAGRDVEAGADALIGLAADALGVGRFAASAMALQRAGALLAEQAPPRLLVRLAWVTAELAMARGEGQAAVPHADRAVESAAALGSARHAVKSEVIKAAALCSAGDVDAARGIADAALQETAGLGIIPLRWALACLLADIGSARLTTADVLEIRNECAATVRRRGGDLADR